ncbi:MAG TPA: ATP-binding cassette domain-containing protein [Candidatus Bipolaricaulota bacterium]
MSPLLCVRGLSKRFDGVLAVSGVHFDVREGDAVGIVGPNGAGKSTLFHLISGTLTPSAGTILYRDQPIQTWTPERRVRAGIARTFQKTRLFYGLTVEENLASGCFLNSGGGVVRLLCGAPRRERLALQRRVDEILALTGLAPFRRRLAWQLSFGYQRRLSVGIALASAPRLLLLDEPFCGQSPQSVEKMGLLLRRLRERGITILLIEHRMESIVSYCSRLLVLQGGRVVIPTASS